MNKPYFAKYLPVIDEIKDGDLIWNPKKPLQRPWIAITPASYNNPHVSYWDGHTKVKLFLCSRDNPNQAQEILTDGIKEGQKFTEEEKDYLTLGSVVEINLAMLDK